MLKKIEELKKEKNIAIVAHHYVSADIQEISDYLSDSYGFFQDIQAIDRRDDIDTIMVIAPTFFAELAVALTNKKVIMPIFSDCPVATHLNFSFERVFQFIKKYPDYPFVCYGTSPLSIKLLADYITIPGRVVETIESIDSPKVLFAGESNCANDALRHLKDKIINYPYNPICNVYNSATYLDVIEAKSRYKDGVVLVHPECKAEVLEVADYVMGTGDILEYIKENFNKRDTFILGTEEGFYQRVKREFPEKNIIHLTPKLICNTFKVFALKDVIEVLETSKKAEEIKLNSGVRKKLRELMINFFKR